MINNQKIGVVIPCYKVDKQILDVIKEIQIDVDQIFIVDDCCPNKSGALVEKNCLDKRVMVVRNKKNLGVGGAVMVGYALAINHGMQIIVKVDGDGQMNPRLIPAFVKPIANGEADYTKGNRFYSLELIQNMPRARVIGNAVLSLITKLSSGYWNIFDPTNGYTAINSKVANLLPFHKISHGYFFETDMLFRLNTIRALVQDIPMQAVYEEEESNLQIHKIIYPFFAKNLKNFFKRIFYNYYLRDLSIASFELPLGILLLISGASFGLFKWIESTQLLIPATAGSVMLSALPILTGLQLILAFLASDIAQVPSRAIHTKLQEIE
jgi:dolichol-phosphate mannosyltransferase